MSNINFDLPAGDLASRKNAILTRESLKALWVEYDLIVINCGSVNSLSESYADELFGILVLQKGYEQVVKKLKIQEASPQVLLSIASVIRRRKLQLTAAKTMSYSAHNQFCNA